MAQTDGAETGKITVAEALADRFSAGTTKRSAEYRRGFESTLKHQLEGGPLPPLPYPEGTAQADAYWSGQDDARDYLAARAERAGRPLFQE